MVTERRSIVTQHPEEEIWYYLSKLMSRHHVKRLLEKRISNPETIKRTQFLLGIKNEYNHSLSVTANGKSAQNRKYLEIYYLLPDEEIEVNTEEICVTIKQAIELFKASKSVSMYAKPIILYYCYTRLAKVLFLSTFSTKYTRVKGSKSHGLTIADDDVKCLNVGAFPRFYDSYSADPPIYTDNAIFDWKSILSSSHTQRYYLFENMRKDNLVTIKSKSNNRFYTIHELTRELLFTYAMSMLARYEIMKWKAIIESENNDLIWTIEGYLKSTQSFFPNLILNELHGIRFFFFAESRAGPENPNYEI